MNYFDKGIESRKWSKLSERKASKTFIGTILVHTVMDNLKYIFSWHAWKPDVH